jgi:hypothetical protein
MGTRVEYTIIGLSASSIENERVVGISHVLSVCWKAHWNGGILHGGIHFVSNIFFFHKKLYYSFKSWRQ